MRDQGWVETDRNELNRWAAVPRAIDGVGERIVAGAAPRQQRARGLRNRPVTRYSSGNASDESPSLSISC